MNKKHTLKTETNKDNTATEKTNHLSDSEIIKILTSLIVILVIYILSIQIIDFYKTENETMTFEFLTMPEESNLSAEIKVNINSDNIFELMQLDGIGEAKAKAILEYRKENGNFISIDELMNVPGIGEALFEKIKNSVTIE